MRRVVSVPRLRVATKAKLSSFALDATLKLINVGQQKQTPEGEKSGWPKKVLVRAASGFNDSIASPPS